MRTKSRRGMVMLEMVISSILTLFVGSMLLMFVRIHVVSRQLAMDQHSSEQTAWRPMHRLADNIRKAQQSGTLSALIVAGTATSITINNDTAGDTTRYWLDSTKSPAVLDQTIGTQTLPLAIGLKSLTFTYYLATGNTPAQGSCWVTTANPNAPTAAEMPNIVAIGITVTTTLDGGTKTFTTSVRLRNGSRTVSGN